MPSNPCDVPSGSSGPQPSVVLALPTLSYNNLVGIIGEGKPRRPLKVTRKTDRKSNIPCQNMMSRSEVVCNLFGTTLSREVWKKLQI